MDASLSTNYPGAAIFWSYNLAALGLTSIVIYTLTSIRSVNDGTQNKGRRLTQLFSALAAISFSTLSFNMLNVLIQSYNAWSKLAPSSYATGNESMMNRIWTWSITSTLFRDFGEAIVANQARYVWVLTALFATMSVCSYMGVEGSRRRVPRLWAFFALSQILPISFAQNLSYIALIRQPAETQPVDVWPTGNAIVTVVYSLGLAIAPRTAHTSALMPLIIVARLLLFSQMVLVKTGTGSTSPTLARRLQTPVGVMGVLLVVRQAYLAVQEFSLAKIGMAVFDHPAVSALGVDLVLCAVSYIFWTFFGGHGKATSDSKKAS